MKTFKKYLKNKNLNSYRFAVNHGLTQPACRRAEMGQAVSAETAYKIILATNYEVDFLSLIFPNKSKKEVDRIIASICYT